MKIKYIYPVIFLLGIMLAGTIDKEFGISGRSANLKNEPIATSYRQK